MLDATKRRRLLLVSLVATLGASAWTYWRQSRDEAAEPIAKTTAPRSARIPVAPPAPSDVQIVNLSEARSAAFDGEVMNKNPFAVKSWLPPVPPPAPLPPPPPPMEPTAPTLPFKYLGRQEEVENPNSAVFYFSVGDESFVARAGEKLANDYRFDGMENGFLLFTYLPLSARQTLPVGGAP